MLIYAKENDLDALTREGFCVVDFYSETCGPCMMLAPVLEKLESALPFVRFIKATPPLTPITRGNTTFRPCPRCCS